MELAQENGASSWLTTLPVTDLGHWLCYTQKMAFCNLCFKHSHIKLAHPDSSIYFDRAVDATTSKPSETLPQLSWKKVLHSPVVKNL